MNSSCGLLTSLSPSPSLSTSLSRFKVPIPPRPSLPLRALLPVPALTRALPRTRALSPADTLATATAACLAGAHYQSLLKTLTAVFSALGHFSGPARASLVWGVLLHPGIFRSLFLHWNPEVRKCFMLLLRYRLARSADPERVLRRVRGLAAVSDEAHETQTQKGEKTTPLTPPANDGDGPPSESESGSGRSSHGQSRSRSRGRERERVGVAGGSGVRATTPAPHALEATLLRFRTDPSSYAAAAAAAAATAAAAAAADPYAPAHSSSSSSTSFSVRERGQEVAGGAGAGGARVRAASEEPGARGGALVGLGSHEDSTFTFAGAHGRGTVASGGRPTEGQEQGQGQGQGQGARLGLQGIPGGLGAAGSARHARAREKEGEIASLFGTVLSFFGLFTSDPSPDDVAAAETDPEKARSAGDAAPSGFPTSRTKLSNNSTRTSSSTSSSSSGSSSSRNGGGKPLPPPNSRNLSRLTVSPAACAVALSVLTPADAADDVRAWRVLERWVHGLGLMAETGWAPPPPMAAAASTAAAPASTTTTTTTTTAAASTVGAGASAYSHSSANNGTGRAGVSAAIVSDRVSVTVGDPLSWLYYSPLAVAARRAQMKPQPQPQPQPRPQPQSQVQARAQARVRAHKGKGQTGAGAAIGTVVADAGSAGAKTEGRAEPPKAGTDAKGDAKVDGDVMNQWADFAATVGARDQTKAAEHKEAAPAPSSATTTTTMTTTTTKPTSKGKSKGKGTGKGKGQGKGQGSARAQSECEWVQNWDADTDDGTLPPGRLPLPPVGSTAHERDRHSNEKDGAGSAEGASLGGDGDDSCPEFISPLPLQLPYIAAALREWRFICTDFESVQAAAPFPPEPADEDIAPPGAAAEAEAAYLIWGTTAAAHTAARHALAARSGGGAQKDSKHDGVRRWVYGFIRVPELNFTIKRVPSW